MFEINAVCKENLVYVCLPFGNSGLTIKPLDEHNVFVKIQIPFVADVEKIVPKAELQTIINTLEKVVTTLKGF